MFVKHRACILINDIGQINGVQCYEKIGFDDAMIMA